MESLIFGLCFVWIQAVEGFYLMSDYYMDSGHSKTFGGVCGEVVMDDSFYLNSHVNNLKLTKYPWNNECWMVADAGTMPGARYRIYIDFLSLQEPNPDGVCTQDYLQLNTTDSVTYCGDMWSNETWLAPQPKIYIKFHTDDNIQRKGFKIKFVRSEPSPCQLNEFFCRHENRCIDGRLKCDGTPHCLLQDDEADCNGWETFIGSILALGTSGVTGVGAGLTATVVVAILLVIITCCCKRAKCAGPVREKCSCRTGQIVDLQGDNVEQSTKRKKDKYRKTKNEALSLV